MANVGEAIIKLTFDTKDVSSKLGSVEKEAKNKFSGLGQGVKSGLGTAAKTAGAAIAAMAATGTAAVVGLTKKSLELGATWEQQIGGAETLFGNAANSVLSNAQNAFNTAQISQTDYMDTVTSFAAAMTTSLGGNMTKAAQMADQAVIDMADNANKMGTDMSSLQWAYQGFAKQNYTMLDNLKLGYGGTKKEMERLLADAGKIAGTKFDIGNFADVTEAIHVMQVQMGIAGTSAKEGTETVSGSLNRLKSSWTNLLTTMTTGGGPQALEQNIKDVIDSVQTFARNIMPMAKSVLTGISSLVSQILPEMAALIADMLPDVLPMLANAISSVVVSLAKVLPTVLKVLIEALIAVAPELLDAIMQTVNALISMLPQLMPVIVELITGIAEVLTSPQNLKAILKAGITLFMELVKAVPQILGALVGAVGGLVSSIFSILGEKFGPAGEFIGTVAAGIGTIWNNITTFFGNIFAAIGSFFAQVWAILAGVATTVYNIVLAPIINFIQNAIIAIVAIVAGLLQIVYNIVAPVVQWVWNAVLQPVINFVSGAINTIWGVISGVIVTIQNAIRAAIGVVSGVFSAFVGWVNASIINPIRNFFNGLWNGVKSAAVGAVNGIRGAFSSVASWFSNVVVNPIRNAFNRLGNGTKTVFGAVKGAIQKTFSTIGGVVKAPINGIISGANRVISKINGLKVPDWVPGLGGRSPHFGLIPTLAEGGYANGTTGAIIGEAGREVVLPLERNTDNWAGLLASTLVDTINSGDAGISGRPITVNMTNDINNEMDANDIGRLLMQSIRRAA